MQKVLGEITEHLKKGNSKPAIELINKHGLHEKGAELLHRGGWPGPAGDHYKKAADLEANRSEVDHKKLRQLVAKAATAYEEGGMHSAAERMTNWLRILASR